MIKPQSEETQIALIQRDVAYIKKAIDNFNTKYVTIAEFKPVKALAYGATGLILTSVMVGIIALVIK